MRQTLCSFMDDASRRDQQTAIIQRRGLRTVRWSYAEVAQSAWQVARELEARGVGRGDRVLLWAENSAEWVAAFFGCLFRRSIAVPLDEKSPPELVARIQRQVSAKLMFCGYHQRDLLHGTPAVSMDELREAVRRHARTPYDATAVIAEDLAEIIFTSGTTSEPKGVCLTHRNVLANLNQLETEIEQRRRLERWFHPVRILCLLPLSHVFGQTMGIFVPQLLGGEVSFGTSMNPAEIAATVRRDRIMVVAAVPRQLETLRDHVENGYGSRGKLEAFRQKFDRSAGKHFLRRWWMFRDLHRRLGWRFVAIVSGGATLNEGIETFWRRVGFAVVQGYGLTETSSLVSVNHPFRPSRGSIGKALPGQEVRLAENGEILVRGDNVSAGYWSGTGTAPARETDSWLHTGDIGALDAQGNLFFKGRQKDVIVTAAGVNVYPEDLELALSQQPEVRASCVFDIEGPAGPEAAAALILKDQDTDPATIVRKANATLSPAQQIRRWVVWTDPDFPRTATQKVRRAAVRAMASAQSTAGSAPSLASNRDLKELDSLGRVALLAELEERYQIDLDEAALTPATSTEDLERMIRDQAVVRKDSSGQGQDYPYPRWALRRPSTWFRTVAHYLLIVPYVAILCWPRIQGRERIRGLQGPALLVANHLAMVDPVVILFALPWRFRHRLSIAMGGERLRGFRYATDGLTWLARLWDPVKYLLVVVVFNVFPLPQRSGFRRSFAYAGEAADQGYSILVFPEGRTTTDGKPNPFMPGIGLLAADLNLPVVPIRLEGLFELSRHRRYFPRRGRVTLTFGKPLTFPHGTNPAEITRELEKAVASL